MVLKCDTCGKEADEVKRVVIKKGYNRSGAIPMYNCQSCFKKSLVFRVSKKTAFSMYRLFLFLLP